MTATAGGTPEFAEAAAMAIAGLDDCYPEAARLRIAAAAAIIWEMQGQ